MSTNLQGLTRGDVYPDPLTHLPGARVPNAAGLRPQQSLRGGCGAVPRRGALSWPRTPTRFQTSSANLFPRLSDLGGLFQPRCFWAGSQIPILVSRHRIGAGSGTHCPDPRTSSPAAARPPPAPAFFSLCSCPQQLISMGQGVAEKPKCVGFGFPTAPLLWDMVVGVPWEITGSLA